MCTLPHLFFIYFIYFWLLWVFIAACRLSLVVVHRLLIEVASVVVELGLYGAWTPVVVAHGLSCSQARGLFAHQGSNPCLLHWQMDSVPPGNSCL